MYNQQINRRIQSVVIRAPNVCYEYYCKFCRRMMKALSPRFVMIAWMTLMASPVLSLYDVFTTCIIQRVCFLSEEHLYRKGNKFYCLYCSSPKCASLVAYLKLALFYYSCWSGQAYCLPKRQQIMDIIFLQYYPVFWFSEFIMFLFDHKK